MGSGFLHFSDFDWSVFIHCKIITSLLLGLSEVLTIVLKDLFAENLDA